MQSSQSSLQQANENTRAEQSSKPQIRASREPLREKQVIQKLHCRKILMIKIILENIMYINLSILQNAYTFYRILKIIMIIRFIQFNFIWNKYFNETINYRNQSSQSKDSKTSQLKKNLRNLMTGYVEIKSIHHNWLLNPTEKL